MIIEDGEIGGGGGDIVEARVMLPSESAIIGQGNEVAAGVSRKCPCDVAGVAVDEVDAPGVAGVDEEVIANVDDGVDVEEVEGGGEGAVACLVI